MYETVIGLEIHAELKTRSKMFCGCQVVDSTLAKPNIAVCPVCAGMPGMLPVANRQAVEYGLKVALALGCQINQRSIFARKNYFYPDLPKGFQISQYEQPLARNGHLNIHTSLGDRVIRVRRVHLEEDTGKLTHIEGASLIDLNRAGIPLLEIVSEPDLQSPQEARVYAETLRNILRYLNVNSGDMQKGVMRIEPNVSVRLAGTQEYGIRTEIKNLNSFRALERGIAYEVKRQIEILESGGQVRQETVGWDEDRQITFVQRIKEGEEDYRYYPEPDLPPLVIEDDWIKRVRAEMPELPDAKYVRFQEQYGLNAYDAQVLINEQEIAHYFEAVALISPVINPKSIANWITGDLFSLMNETGVDIKGVRISPEVLSSLLILVKDGTINNTIAKSVLKEMFTTGKSAHEIVSDRGLTQISNVEQITSIIKSVLEENPEQVASYLDGKDGLENWFFGQVMRETRGKANPQVVRAELERQLVILRQTDR